MGSRSASALRIEECLRFLRRHLPERRLRLLDAGCGEGRLVERLVAAGHDAYGIDVAPEAVATARAAGRSVTLSDFLEPRAGAYDAVTFGASLHHMSPLATAVERAHALLAPGGTLLADEFDLVAADGPTATWFFSVSDALAAAGVIAPEAGHHDRDPLVGDPAAEPLLRWRERHRHEPPLASGEQMLLALGERFEIVHTERCAYLYGYFLPDLEARAGGGEVARRLLDLERRLVEAGRIRAVGLRIVARPRERPSSEAIAVE
jgi:SAM-dependent methyltransferase